MVTPQPNAPKDDPRPGTGQERRAQVEIGALLVAGTMSGCDRSMNWWPRPPRLM